LAEQPREASVERRQQDHEQEGDDHVAEEGQEHVAHREERQREKDDEEVGRDGLVAKSRLGAETDSLLDGYRRRRLGRYQVGRVRSWRVE
jgi:hypothetical protein